jgi:hypothetical protein
MRDEISVDWAYGTSGAQVAQGVGECLICFRPLPASPKGHDHQKEEGEGREKDSVTVAEDEQVRGNRASHDEG